MYKIATVVAYAFNTYYFKNAAIVAYVGLRVKCIYNYYAIFTNVRELVTKCHDLFSKLMCKKVVI